MTGLHIAPPIADHEAVGKTQARVAGGVFEHAGFRLPARTPIAIVMVADSELIERKR